jgi:hypothetical protein
VAKAADLRAVAAAIAVAAVVTAVVATTAAAVVAAAKEKAAGVAAIDFRPKITAAPCDSRANRAGKRVALTLTLSEQT